MYRLEQIMNLLVSKYILFSILLKRRIFEKIKFSGLLESRVPIPTYRPGDENQGLPLVRARFLQTWWVDFAL